MKRYAELIRNYKKQRIKSFCDNIKVIDSDYRGEVIVAIHNDSDTEKEVDPDERIAQLVILPFLTWDINEVEELGDTDRGKGGFGSTGR